MALPALARVPSRSATAITVTRLRAAPERRAEPLLRLPEGAIITVRGKAENGWYQAHHGQLKGYVLTGDVATEPVTLTTDARSGETLDDPNVVALEQRARGLDRAPRRGRNQDDPLRGSGDSRHRGRSQSPPKPKSGCAGDGGDAPRRAGRADGPAAVTASSRSAGRTPPAGSLAGISPPAAGRRRDRTATRPPGGDGS